MDMLVKKTDIPKGMSVWQASRKAAIMNISDLAAKGAKPVALLASVGVPSDLCKSDIQQIGKGLNEGAREYGAYVLGGDTNQASDLIISCMAFGECNKQNLLKRSGAKVGDYVEQFEKIGLASLHTGLLREGLHFEIRHNTEAQDPTTWLDPSQISYKQKIVQQEQ